MWQSDPVSDMRRLMSISLSSHSMPISSISFKILSSVTVSESSTKPEFSPCLMELLSARAPMARDSAPISIDLPAPVSPVRILSPGVKLISASSMRARFLTCRFVIIIPPLLSDTGSLTSIIPR